VNEAILQKTRMWTLAATVVVGLGCGFLISWRFALGFAVSSIWAVAGFWVLERLLRAVVVPPGTARHTFRCVAWTAAKLALYGVAAWGLLTHPFPAMSYALGLTLLLLVLVAVGVTTRPRDDNQPARRGDNA